MPRCVCPAIAASSPSPWRRRSGLPRPTTTSSWDTRRPTAPALARLLIHDRAAARVTLMIDDLAQLDLIDAIAAPGRRANVRVAIDADASWRAPGLGHIGVRRSPLFTAARGRRIRAPRRRPPRLHAGRPDDVRGPDRRSARRHRLGRWRDPLDAAPLARGAAHAPFRHRRGRPPHRSAGVRQRRWHRLPGVHGRRPRRHRAHRGKRTAGRTPLRRLPGVRSRSGRGLRTGCRPKAPARCGDGAGRRMDRLRAARGVAPAASGLARRPEDAAPRGRRRSADTVAGTGGATPGGGGRVWFRHAKSGELSERVDAFHLVEGDRVVRELPTYRGEGQAFL